MANLIKFDFEGAEYSVDADAAKSYSVMRGLMLGDEDPKGFFKALMLLFGGKDAEYVDRLGGMDRLAEFIPVAMEAAGAKNS